MAKAKQGIKLKFRTIRQRVMLPAPVEAVYDAWIDPKIHTEFSGGVAMGKAVKGGGFTAWDGYIAGKYKLLIKYKKIVAEWSTSEWPDNYPPSIVTLVFTEKKNGTEIVLLHEKVPAEQTDEYAQGWIDFYWDPFKDYFKGK